jgi:hypothetical protein
MRLRKWVTGKLHHGDLHAQAAAAGRGGAFDGPPTLLKAIPKRNGESPALERPTKKRGK